MCDQNVASGTTFEADACWVYILFSLIVRLKVKASSFKVVTA